MGDSLPVSDDCAGDSSLVGDGLNRRFFALKLQDSSIKLHERSKESSKTMKQLAKFFPNKIIIQPPQFLNRIGLECDDLEKICMKDQTLSSETLFQHNKKELDISLSLTSFFQDVVTENEFEKRLLADVVPPKDIGIAFDDIGALENVKDTLKELVMLPLQRPELFCKGQLTKVDSLLRKRENSGEHEGMRKMKNEFMVNWDGLCTKDKERVLVLGATNRPFDLDEAVIRRFPRR
ncbi:hypothetical protein BHE74_00002074 [Ensete ventricosum]|nr:hypothetical protein GW17_00001736 [Ensete ventricosum]RWW89023.1 hypothetical protein BHE74_00002074 [Ensete ventricosum]